MEIINIDEMKWRTATGKSIPVMELDHQHLSNIVWYYKLIVGCRPHPVIQEIINLHHLGVVLDFKPLPIPHELRDLFDKGYLRDNGFIVYENKIIGSVTHIDNWKELIELY